MDLLPWPLVQSSGRGGGRIRSSVGSRDALAGDSPAGKISENIVLCSLEDKQINFILFAFFDFL